MRVFVAVRPPDDVLSHLDAALGGVGAGSGGPPWLRWVPGPNRHVTVAFYGEVPQGSAEELAYRLDEVCATVPAFDASLRGAGSFGGRTLWIGCSGQGWRDLMQLAGAVGSQVASRAPDRRSRPHLTVARVSGRAGARPDVGRLESISRALAVYSGPEWPVTQVALVRSDVGAGPSGTPRHTELHRSSLVTVAG